MPLDPRAAEEFNPRVATWFGRNPDLAFCLVFFTGFLILFFTRLRGGKGFSRLYARSKAAD